MPKAVRYLKRFLNYYGKNKHKYIYKKKVSGDLVDYRKFDKVLHSMSIPQLKRKLKKMKRDYPLAFK